MNPQHGQPNITLQGRIDGLTAFSVRERLDQVTVNSTGKITVDLSQVAYLSSAGLRVFLQVQKELKKAGGEMILISPSSCVVDVLRISGMEKIFTILSGNVSSQRVETPTPDAGEVKMMHVQERDYTIEMEHYPIVKGNLESFGNPSPRLNVSYGEADVHRYPCGQFHWGAGIAASGNTYEEYRNLFGESVILASHFFSYPAVRRPSVDYILHHEESSDTLNFLYGFGFSGNFCALGRFDLENLSDKTRTQPPCLSGQPGDLSGLLSTVSRLLDLPVFGVTLAGRSDGIYGMHLRQSPASGVLASGTSVSDPDIFPGWFSFPTEPDDYNTIVLATGLFSARDPLHPSPVDNLLPPGSCCHLHAVVMERGLMNYHYRGLLEEVDRIGREFEPRKVVHLLPASRIIKGIMGIIPL